MEIRIRPLDPLFFRNGRPFTMGDESWADSIFPPNPSVLYGALRTAMATTKGKNIPFASIKTQLDNKVLQIGQLYYFLENQAYFPLPLDYVENKSKSNETREKEKAEKQYTVSLSKTAPRKGIVEKEKESLITYILYAPFDRGVTPEGALVSENALLGYLENETATILSRKLSDYIKEEPKVGNGRTNQTKSVEESLLYRIGMQRLLDVDLGISLRLSAGYTAGDLHGTQVKLGGEGKIAVIKGISDQAPLQTKVLQIKLKPGFFKLYFATPAIIDNESGWPKLSVDAHLVAANIGKFQSIGGYDIVENKPKTMYKTIPAGSVLYYETNEAPEKIEALQGQSFSDFRQEEGFGIAYFGNFTPPTHL